MDDLVLQNDYTYFKQQLDAELNKTAESFVVIGYLLKTARDSDVLKAAGYSTVAEFAKSEYGLSKDSVSRFMAINDRFSEGGYSDKLCERWTGVGVAKLGEMLTLSDEVIEILPEDITRTGIQDVKREVREENQISDIEVALELTDEEVSHESLLFQWMHYYFKSNIEQYNKMFGYNQADDKENHLFNAIAPSGVAVLSTRIPQKGKVMLSIRGLENDVELVNVRTNEKQSYPWAGVVACAAEFVPQNVISVNEVETPEEIISQATTIESSGYIDLQEQHYRKLQEQQNTLEDIQGQQNASVDLQGQQDIQEIIVEDEENTINECIPSELIPIENIMEDASEKNIAEIQEIDEVAPVQQEKIEELYQHLDNIRNWIDRKEYSLAKQVTGMIVYKLDNLIDIQKSEQIEGQMTIEDMADII